MTTTGADDLRRLLDSDRLDSDDYRGAFPVLLREELLAQTDGLPVTDDQLERIAATAGSAVDNLGG